MDLRLTQEQKMTRKMVRELAAKEIAPIAAEIDETGRFPREVMEKMAEAGLFGILIPPPFGGAGGDRLAFVLSVEEMRLPQPRSPGAWRRVSGSLSSSWPSAAMSSGGSTCLPWPRGKSWELLPSSSPAVGPTGR
jgi:alkylation response protein AidB-like acyl-CoA dehydrogenase